MTLFLFLHNSGCNSPLDCCYARTILGLPGKIGNANIMTATERLRFLFCSFSASGGKCPLDTFFARTILGLPRKIGNANIQP